MGMATTPDIEFERGLPASLDAERTILGAVLLDNHAYSEAASSIRADDFALTAHQRVFARMGELIDRNHVVDIVTLSEELARRKEIESVGGVAWLASLTEGLPRRLSIEEYVRIVKDKSLLRQLINICSGAITRAADQSEEALDVLNAAETSLLEVTEKGITRGFSSVHDIVAGSFKTIDNLYKEGREITGLATHLTEFDRMTSGLQKSELIIIAARPSMGKTALAINIAQNAAIQSGKIVAVFSLEMSKESLLRRMLASEATVDSVKIQKGFLLREDRDKLTAALERLVEARIFVDDTPGISLTEMRAKARRLRQSAGGLDLVVIDYLQLMSAGGMGPAARRYENRTQEVSAISRGLKALAKELDIPVMALSQLSRASEQRSGDKKPILSDLRESGSIEQDADVVAFIHRESYYNRDSSGEPDPDSENKAEIIIAKQRNGPTGSIEVAWVSKCTKFGDRSYGNQGGEF
jgi:replicative DNA helicase